MGGQTPGQAWVEALLDMGYVWAAGGRELGHPGGAGRRAWYDPSTQELRISRETQEHLSAEAAKAAAASPEVEPHWRVKAEMYAEAAIRSLPVGPPPAGGD